MDNPIDQPLKVRSEIKFDFPTANQMLLLLLFIFLSLFVGLVLIGGLGMAMGMPLTEIQDAMGGLNVDSSEKMINFVRSSILINHLTMFVIPGILFTYMIYKSKWRQFLRLHRSPKAVNWFLGFILLLVSFPLIQYSFYINSEFIPLPEWARTMENNTAGMIEALLATDSPFLVLFNVLIIAVVPAFGEELIFRGLLQGKIMDSLKNPVAAIWITAILFSAFHMQFEGFIPRLLLGALLGYLYYWTNNLWVPIIAHFLNNFLQVVAQYLYSHEMSELNIDEIESVPVWSALVSLVLVVGLGWYLCNYNREHKTPMV